MEEACLQANYELRKDARALLEKALSADNPPIAIRALSQLIANYQIAASKRMPLCQDCGYVTAFVDLGNRVTVENGSLEEAVQGGISGAYRHHDLRQSVIADPLFERANFGTDRIGGIHVSLIRGEKCVITLMPKGGGGDNASRLAMMRPTAAVAEIIDFVVDAVAAAGANSCPPLFIGVGIGGSFDTVALLAKKALLRDFEKPNHNKRLAKIESEMLEKINMLGIGPAGLGGKTTALGVSILTAPAHIACMPVAVNISCNSLRSIRIEL